MRKSNWFMCCIFAVLTTSTYAGNVKSIRIGENEVATVKISVNGSVLSFPLKPTKVVLGKAGSFAVDYVESDLAVSPLQPNARSNLYVYVYGRRFTFDLVATPDQGIAVIKILDAKEKTAKVITHE